MKKRVALAYSGGLDTSVAVGWLGVELGYEVIAVAVDVGQDVDFDALRKRALAAGAVEVEVVDAREELLADIAMPTLAANALYEGRYPLVSALSRPVIVRHLVAAARRHGASAVAHGATGKGNDQVRFEVGTRALAPDLETLAPVRVWGMSREETIDYAERHDIAVTVSKDRIYSIDANLWGRAIECGVLEDPWVAPPEDVFCPDGAGGDRARRGDDRLRAGRSGLFRRGGARPRRSRRRDRARGRVGRASGASTWSKADAWESRAGRSTSARLRSPLSWRTPTWKG